MADRRQEGFDEDINLNLRFADPGNGEGSALFMIVCCVVLSNEHGPTNYRSSFIYMDKVGGPARGALSGAH